MVGLTRWPGWNLFVELTGQLGLLSMHASYSSIKGVVGGGRGGLPARSVPFDPVGVK